MIPGARNLPPTPQSSLHDKLHPSEIERILQRVEDSLRRAKSDHCVRNDRWVEYLRKFEAMAEQDKPKPGDEHKSQIQTQVILENVMGQFAQEYLGLWGPGARIHASPVGKSDGKLADTVAAALHSYVFNIMDMPRKAAEFSIYKLLFGRAFAYRPFEQYSDWFVNNDGTREWKPYYTAPDFLPIWPGRAIVPAENVRSLQNFTFFDYDERLSVDELARGEQMQGKYFGVLENIADFHRVAQQGEDLQIWPDELQTTLNQAEGVSPTRTSNMNEGGLVSVHQYHTKLCLPLDLGADVESSDYAAREWNPIPVVIYYVPRLRKIIGIHDMTMIYKRMRSRRPFSEIAMPGIGYWRRGLGDLLWSYEDELNSNERQLTDAVRLSSVGFGVYDSRAGIRGEGFKVQPGKATAVSNVEGFVWNQIDARFDGFTVKHQGVRDNVQRITGRPDFTMGQSMESPTAPDTATGQALMTQAANVRVELDVTLLQKDFAVILKDIWELIREFTDGDLLFRITEDSSAYRLVDSKHGMATITAEEREMECDFAIELAPTEMKRQAKKAEALQIFQLALTNPLIAANPRALWYETNKLYEAFGDKGFAARVPEPPDPGFPKQPDQEWAMLQQGEEIAVNPMDDDALHIQKHQEQHQYAMERDDERDAEAIHKLEQHIIAHEDAIQAKLVLQQAATAALTQLKASGQPQPGGPPQPGAPQPGQMQPPAMPAAPIMQNNPMIPTNGVPGAPV